MKDLLPKQMARIIYDTLTQETVRSSAGNKVMFNEQSSKEPHQNTTVDGELVKVVKPDENSTWRIGLHKRTANSV